jgi:hypothetical protein
MNKNIIKDTEIENLKVILKATEFIGKKGGKLIGQGIDKLADYMFGKEVQ